MSYYNCNSSLVFGNAFAQLRVLSHYKSLLTRCSDRDVKSSRFTSSASSELPFVMTRQCCQSIDHCDTCVTYQPEHPLSVRACEKVQMSYMDAVSSSAGFDFVGCVDSAAHYNTAELISRCCLDASHSHRNWTVADYLQDWQRKAGHHSGSFLDSSADGFVRTDALRLFCKRSQRIADDVRDGLRTSEANLYPSADFVGLGCRTNRSVEFYAMDRRSVYGSAFLRSVFGNKVSATLSANLAAGKSGESSVAIVDINVSNKCFGKKHIPPYGPC